MLSTRKVVGAQAVLTKVSATGKVLWQNNLRQQVTGEDEMPEKVVLDAAGNIYAFAKTRNPEGYMKEAVLAKFSPQGKLLWHKMQFLEDVLVQGEFVYVLGNASHNGVNHVLLRKLNGDGQVIWEQQYADGLGIKLAVDPSLGVIVAGTKQSHVPYENTNLLLLRCAAKDGSLIFEKTYTYQFATSKFNTYNEPGFPAAVHVTSTGAINVLTNASPEPYVYNVILLITDSEGNKKVHKPMGRTNESFVRDVAFSPDGGIYLLGLEAKYRNVFDYFLTRFSSNGEEEWYHTLNSYDGGTIRETVGKRISLSRSGNIALSGHLGLMKRPPAWLAPREYLEQPTFFVRQYDAKGTETDVVVMPSKPDQISSGLSVNFDLEDNLYAALFEEHLPQGSDKGTLTLHKYTATATCSTPVSVKLSLPPFAMKVREQVRTTADFGAYKELQGAGVRWSWGDGTAPSVAYTLPGNPRVTGQHRYAAAGIHTVQLDFAESCLRPGSEEYREEMVIFDPAARAVSGAGLLYSPASPQLALMGEAGPTAFAFAAQYRDAHAKAKPSGAALLLLGRSVLFSRKLDWLVVRGERAALQGTGSINGEGHYRFVATMEDAGGAGLNDAGDKLRLQVWDMTAHGRLVYDNFAVSGPRLSLEQALPGIGLGQVVLHGQGMNPLFAQHLAQAEAGGAAPETELATAFPNPFRERATVSFVALQGGAYSAGLYDSQGALVRQLGEGTAQAGQHLTLEVEAAELKPGLYLVRIQTESSLETLKLILEK
ncbi:T9SS type A sorting domain-containing protein [Pontibacter sp. CAU 1760]